MAAFPAAELSRLTEAAALLLEAEDRLPVLRSLNWDRAVGDAFLKNGALPKPDYPTIDQAPSRERTLKARALISGASPVHRWLMRFADIADETAACCRRSGPKRSMLIPVLAGISGSRRIDSEFTPDAPVFCLVA